MFGTTRSRFACRRCSKQGVPRSRTTSRSACRRSNAAAPTYDSIPPPFPGLMSLQVGPDSGSLSVGVRENSRSVAAGTAPITGVSRRSGGGRMVRRDRRHRRGPAFGGRLLLVVSAAPTGVVRRCRRHAGEPSIGGRRRRCSPTDRPTPSHGSNTIGAELCSPFGRSILETRRDRATGSSRRPGAKAHEDLVVGKESGQTRTSRSRSKQKARAPRSPTSPMESATSGCLRAPIRPEETAALGQKGLGDLSSPATEHVIGLDGIAVIVHPNNPLRALTLTELRGIFTGETRDWSAVGGAPGPDRRLRARRSVGHLRHLQAPGARQR